MRWRFWEKKTSTPTWRVRSRRASQDSARIDLAALVPPAADVLAHATASALLVAGEYGRVAREAWSAQDRDDLARAEAAVLARYTQLRAVLAEYVPDPVEAMAEPLATQSEAFQRISADQWFERVGTCYVVGGFLSDFYRIVSSGLPAAARKDITQVINHDEPEQLVAGVLQRITAIDEAHTWRLSLWARRLVGDTMLICRACLRSGEELGEELYEPVFTDIVTEHTRRLDQLGLTA